MEHMLWTGRPDPPVVWESEASYRRRRSIPIAIGLIVLGPIVTFLSFLLLLRDGTIAGNLDSLIRTIAQITAPSGIPLAFAGIVWLVLIAASNYWDDSKTG